MPPFFRKPHGPKYKAKKVTVDGIVFDSKSEAKYYHQLKVMEAQGHLKILELQPKVYLTEARILYKPDFKVLVQGFEVYIDVKGFATPQFNLKKKLWRFYGPGTLWVVESNDFANKKEVHSKRGGSYVTD